MRQAPRQILWGGGVPSWLPFANGSWPTLYASFANNRYWFNGRRYPDFNSWLTASGGVFTRADTGFFYDASSVRQTAAINAPRFDHHPVTGVARGMRFRGSKTNRCTNSGDLGNSSWATGSSGVTRTSNAAIGLDGTLSATTVIEDSSTGSHAAVSAGITFTNAVAYTWWAKVKAAGRTWVRMSDGNAHGCYFDLQNVKTGQVVAGSTAFIRKLSNGFFLVGFFRTTNFTSGSISVGPASADNTSSYAGDGASGIIVDSVGVELGTYPSDLNPTSGSTLATSPDSLIFGPTNGVPFANFNAAGFTVLVSGTASLGSEASVNQRIVAFDDGTTSNAVAVSRGSTSGTGGVAAVFENTGGTGSIGIGSTQSINDDRQFRICAAWRASSQAMSLNGLPVVTAGGNSVLPSINRMVVGNRSDMGRGMFGCIDEIAVFPLRATNAEVERLAKPSYPSFGFFTDLHYNPTKSNQVVAGEGTRVFTDAYSKLTDAVATWNARSNLGFIFQCGDFVEQDASSSIDLTNLGAIESLLQTSNVPQKHIDGNHDLWNLTKAQFGAGTGMPSAPYSFDVGGVHVVVLDGNFSADDDASGYGGTGNETSSYIPPGGRSWLTADLAATSLPTIAFCHYPFMTELGAILANAAAVRAIFEASGKVFAVINGHAHTNGLDIVNGIRYYTMMAMVESAYPANAYAVVSVNPNDLSVQIEGFGGQTSYT